MTNSELLHGMIAVCKELGARGGLEDLPQRGELQRAVECARRFAAQDRMDEYGLAWHNDALKSAIFNDSRQGDFSKGERAWKQL